MHHTPEASTNTPRPAPRIGGPFPPPVCFQRSCPASYGTRLLGAFLASLLLALFLAPEAARGGENWPGWRGPRGTGVSAEKGLPIKWDSTRGLIWKCPLPEWGASTPAIWNESIFVTSHTAEDKLVLLCIDAKQGRVVWQREAGAGTAPREAPPRSTQKFHALHNLASPSPAADAQRVVAHFGNGDLCAFSHEGDLLWKRNLQEDYGPYSIWYGHANSPVLHEGLVFSVCMQDSLAGQRPASPESYLVAHDLRDGHVKWKTPRQTRAEAEQADAYTTPLLVEIEGRAQLVVMGANQLDAYDPRSGKQLWFLPNLVGGRTVTGPTAGHGLVFATQGLRGPLVAVRTSKTGELSYRDIAWKHREGTPDTCCPVLWDALLFIVSDDGIARCFDARTGALKWRERLPGNYKASPVAAEGRIFFLNTEGLCTVVSAAPRFDRLTENQLPDETLASPAVSGGRLFIRGKTALYCLGKGL